MSELSSYLIGKSHFSTSIKVLSNDKNKRLELPEIMMLFDTIYEIISDDERLFIISTLNILLDYLSGYNYAENKIITFITKTENCISTLKSIDYNSYIDILDYTLLYFSILLHFRYVFTV